MQGVSSFSKHFWERISVLSKLISEFVYIAKTNCHLKSVMQDLMQEGKNLSANTM